MSNASLSTPVHETCRYFSCWSASFYPQLLQNWQRRSVVGYSFDYVALNLLGYACYSVFNLALFYSSAARAAYAQAHGGEMPAVRSNDVFFALHALALTLVLIFQIVFCYERGGQRVSRPCLLALAAAALVLPSLAALAAWHPAGLCGITDAIARRTGSGVAQSSLAQSSLAQSSLAQPSLAQPSLAQPPARPPPTPPSSPPLPALCTWLSLLYTISYVKLAVTLVKYIPQVVLNARLRSTAGWNIDNVVLDFMGGFLSLAQLLLDAACARDWTKVRAVTRERGARFPLRMRLLALLVHFSHAFCTPLAPS